MMHMHLRKRGIAALHLCLLPTTATHDMIATLPVNLLRTVLSRRRDADRSMGSREASAASAGYIGFDTTPVCTAHVHRLALHSTSFATLIIALAIGGCARSWRSIGMLESNVVLTALHADGLLNQLLEGAVSSDAPTESSESFASRRLCEGASSRPELTQSIRPATVLTSSRSVCVVQYGPALCRTVHAAVQHGLPRSTHCS